MKKVLILGNGVSREYFQGQIERFEGDIWGCNWIFLDYFEGITRISSLHHHMMLPIAKHRLDNKLYYEIFCDETFVTNINEDYEYFNFVNEIFFKKEKHRNYDENIFLNKKKDLKSILQNIEFFSFQKGWTTGVVNIVQAHLEKYEEINLVGFDFGGKDIYQSHFLNGNNFKIQFKKIVEIYPELKNKIKIWNNIPKDMEGIVNEA